MDSIDGLEISRVMFSTEDSFEIGVLYDIGSRCMMGERFITNHPMAQVAVIPVLLAEIHKYCSMVVSQPGSGVLLK